MHKLSITIFSTMLLVTTSAASAVEWRGGGAITELNGICENTGGWELATIMKIRYRPANVGTNNSYAGFGVFSTSFAFGVGRDGGFTKRLRAVDAHGVSAPGFEVPDVKFGIKTKPKIVGRYENFPAGAAGCIMTITGTVQKRP